MVSQTQQLFAEHCVDFNAALIAWREQGMGRIDPFNPGSAGPKRAIYRMMYLWAEYLWLTKEERRAI